MHKLYITAMKLIVFLVKIVIYGLGIGMVAVLFLWSLLNKLFEETGTHEEKLARKKERERLRQKEWSERKKVEDLEEEAKKQKKEEWWKYFTDSLKETRNITQKPGESWEHYQKRWDSVWKIYTEESNDVNLGNVHTPDTFVQPAVLFSYTQSELIRTISRFGFVQFD